MKAYATRVGSGPFPSELEDATGERMRERMRETRELLEYGPKGVDPLLREESQALLDWMVDQHFTFLGYREYKVSTKGKRGFLNVVEGSGLD